MAHQKDTDERRFSRMYGEIRVGALTARRAQRAALSADACRLDQEPSMKDDAAISHERLWIQPAGINGGKLPSVHPCPEILALQRAIFEAAPHAPGAH
jgi:hypothetical protein